MFFAAYVPSGNVRLPLSIISENASLWSKALLDDRGGMTGSRHLHKECSIRVTSTLRMCSKTLTLAVDHLVYDLRMHLK